MTTQTEPTSNAPLLILLAILLAGGYYYYRRRTGTLSAIGELAEMAPAKPGDLLKAALVKFRERIREADVDGAQDFLDLATIAHNTMEARTRARASRELHKAARKLEEASRRLLNDAEAARDSARRYPQDDDDGLSGIGDLQFEDLEIGQLDNDADEEEDDAGDSAPMSGFDEPDDQEVPPFGPPDFKFVLPKWES